MNVEEIKYCVFISLWEKYEEIKPILLQAGIHEARLPDRAKLEKTLHQWHVSKLEAGVQFIESFITKYINPWKKIRSENTEEYWKRAELFNWGDEYLEVRALRQAGKLIRTEWFDRLNFLVKESTKEKKSEQVRQSDSGSGEA